ncbi:MAG: hypothetical protein ACRECE_03485 [Xanthobacteraceae bacterium]
MPDQFSHASQDDFSAKKAKDDGFPIIIAFCIVGMSLSGWLATYYPHFDQFTGLISQSLWG